MAYRTTCKRVTGKAPFKLLYGKEAVMTMQYIIPSIRIVAIIGMSDEREIKERMTHLVSLEKDHFITGFHQ